MSAFPEYANYDALGLAELVRRGEVSPTALVEEAALRIERVNPALNAVVTRMYGRARAWAGQKIPEGPFRGVPFVLKDLVASMVGVPLTSGSRFMRYFVPGHDSELVTRYRNAGLLVVARSASPEFGLTPATEPEAYGPTGTPWAPERAAGGSSGGSAALVASGAVPMAHGGDGGGSIRIPASCCGVFGFKPTRGRTPCGPDAGEHWHGLAIEHALTRSVRDSAALLDATCAPEAGAPYAAPPPERPFLEEVGRAPGKLRIGFTAQPFLPSNVQPEAVAAVEDAAKLCASLGHDVSEASLPIDRTLFARDLLAVIAAEVAAELDEWERARGRKHRFGEIEVQSALVALYGRALSAARLAEAVRSMRALGFKLASFFAEHDVLLTPTLAAAPPLHGALRPHGAEALAQTALARAGLGAALKIPQVLDAVAAKVYDFIPFTPLANVTGAPSMSVPLYWTPEGLPCGAMFTAPLGADGVLFRLAGQLEAARPWAGRRPKVHAFEPA